MPNHPEKKKLFKLDMYITKVKEANCKRWNPTPGLEIMNPAFYQYSILPVHLSVLLFTSIFSSIAFYQYSHPN